MKMLDINGIINIGNRLSKKRSELSDESWENFVNYYFNGNHKAIDKFIFLSQHSLTTIAEFDRYPQLSLNGLYRSVIEKTKTKIVDDLTRVLNTVSQVVCHPFNPTS